MIDTNIEDISIIAKHLSLPLTICSVTFELYGYAEPVLDRQAALRNLKVAYMAEPNRSWTDEIEETGMAILEARVERITRMVHGI